MNRGSENLYTTHEEERKKEIKRIRDMNVQEEMTLQIEKRNEGNKIKKDETERKILKREIKKKEITQTDTDAHMHAHTDTFWITQ